MVKEKEHVIVRATSLNGFEFATNAHGVFSITKKEDLKDFMERNNYTYEIVKKKSRLR